MSETQIVDRQNLEKPQTVLYMNMPQIGQERDFEDIQDKMYPLAVELELFNLQWRFEKKIDEKSWVDRDIREILEGLKKGDNLIVWELRHLGETARGLLEILAVICEKKINVFFIKEKIFLAMRHILVHTHDLIVVARFISTPVAELFLKIVEIDRLVKSKRIKKSLAQQKASGVKLGRPIGTGRSQLDPYHGAIEQMLKEGVTQIFIAKKFNVLPATLSFWLKKNKLRK